MRLEPWCRNALLLAFLVKQPECSVTSLVGRLMLLAELDWSEDPYKGVEGLVLGGSAQLPPEPDTQPCSQTYKPWFIFTKQARQEAQA